MRRKEGSLCSAFLFLLFTQYVESFFVQNDRASPVAGSVSSTVTIPSARTSLLPVEDEGSGTFDDDTLETRPNGNSTAAVIDDEDSLVQYEKDVTKVLRELRPWKYDPSVPGWFRTRKLSFTNYWGLSEWELHTSRNRYIRYIIDFPKSRLLRRLYPQMTVLLVWCLVTNSLARRLGLHRFLGAETTALSLVSTFVAAIQTLRSNQGLGRLADARLAMGRMVLYTRDLAQLFSTYISPRDPQLGIRAARHLALFGWVLKSHFRETSANDIVETLLVAPSADASYVLGQRKRPIAILARLRQMMMRMLDSKTISTTEHRLIEDNIRSLDEVITVGERIRASPIPPVYNAHATRLMVVYLFCLPWALLGSNMGATSATVITLVVGFAMLGLDEMSHMFEQPFRFMPLYQIAKVSMLDVADAFCRFPPPLDEREAAGTLNDLLLCSDGDLVVEPAGRTVSFQSTV